MSTSGRLVIVFTQTTDAAEDLMAALDMAKVRPWKPLPPGSDAGGQATPIHRLRRPGRENG